MSRLVKITRTSEFGSRSVCGAVQSLSSPSRRRSEKHEQATQYAQVNSGRYKDVRTLVGRQAAATLAYGLHKLGRTAAAERIIQQVITSGEVSPQIGYFAAVIFHSRERRDVARQLLQKSLSSYIAFPEQESARQLLNEILAEAATDGVGKRSTNPRPE